jgi:hypothetical protein
MKTHIYASYNRSAPGFHYGYFDKSQFQNDFRPEDLQDSPILKIFETGYIDNVVGNISKYCKIDPGCFILLYKRLKYSYTDEELESKRLKYNYADDRNKDLGKNFIINIAFTFEEKEKETFKKFYSYFKNEDEKTIAELLADSLIPDTKDEIFGYYIDGKNFWKFLDAASHCKCNSNDSEKIEDSLVVKVNNSQDKSDDLKEIFHLKNDFYFSHETEKKRYLVKQEIVQPTMVSDYVGTRTPAQGVPHQSYFLTDLIKKIGKKF